MNKIFIIIIILAIGIGGYFIFYKKPTQSENAQPQQEQSSKQPPAANENNAQATSQTVSQPKSNTQTFVPKDQIADWKTYQNTQVGLEFKYPPAWKIIDNSPNQSASVKFGLIIDTGKGVLEQSGFVSVFEVSFNTFESQYKAVLQNMGDSVKESDTVSHNLSGKKYTTVAQNGKQINYVYDYDFNGKTLRIVFYSYLNQPDRPNGVIDLSLQKTIDIFAKTFKSNK